MKARSEKGFTLVEVVVMLAILMILLGVGLPSLFAAMKNSRLSSDYGDLVGALFLARSEAVKHSTFVSVCARASDDSCGEDWSNGWLVFTDFQNQPNDMAGVIDQGDRVLRVVAPIDDRELSSFAVLSELKESPGAGAPQAFVQYNPRGTNNWSTGTFTLCDSRGVDVARAVNLIPSGDIRKARKADGIAVPSDVFGQPISCP